MEYFIESVRKYPCLWKVDTNEYKNNELKEAAWRNIIVECDIPDVKEAKCMWKKLRDGHRQALNKKKTTTGQAASIDNRLWKYEKQMEFLLPHFTNRRRDTNASATQDTEIDNNETVETLGNTQTEENSEVATNNESQQTTHYNTLARPKRKIDKITDYFEQEQKRRIQRSNDRDLFRKELLSQEKNVKPKEDTALKKFFDSMYAYTNDLPEYLQMRAQRKIFDIVMEIREEASTRQRETPAQNNFSRQCQNNTYLVSLPCSSDSSGYAIPQSNVHTVQFEDSTTSTTVHTQYEDSCGDDSNSQCRNPVSPGTNAYHHENIRSSTTSTTVHTQYEDSCGDDSNSQCRNPVSPGTNAYHHENIRSFISNQTHYTEL